MKIRIIIQDITEKNSEGAYPELYRDYSFEDLDHINFDEWGIDVYDMIKQLKGGDKK